MCHVTFDENFRKLLRFEPKKLTQAWRFVTYMLLHEDWIHLLLNVLMQTLFAYFLELRHCRVYVVVLYFTGGITAVLGASCFHPELVLGASGGVYTLLISNISDIFMVREKNTKLEPNWFVLEFRKHPVQGLSRPLHSYYCCVWYCLQRHPLPREEGSSDIVGNPHRRGNVRTFPRTCVLSKGSPESETTKVESVLARTHSVSYFVDLFGCCGSTNQKVYSSQCHA